ncbi:MAG: hypothetical protein ACO3L7_06710, partial [Poseidonia sp.]
PLLVIGPSSTPALHALLNGEPFPAHVPPADLARQFVAWFSLGAAGIGFPVQWVLGDVEADLWVRLDPVNDVAQRLDGMPQPNGWKRTKLVPCPSHHTVPSCGWLLNHGPTQRGL